MLFGVISDMEQAIWPLLANTSTLFWQVFNLLICAESVYRAAFGKECLDIVNSFPREGCPMSSSLFKIPAPPHSYLLASYPVLHLPVYSLEEYCELHNHMLLVKSHAF